jgi:signal transduction histidine kinase
MSLRPSSMSVLVQVALLAVFAVVATQAVTFAVVLLAPAPQPTGFSIAAAADALQGRTAETSDGRALRRAVADRPGLPDTPIGPVEIGLITALAQQLDVPPGFIRVRLAPEDRGLGSWERSGRRPPAPGSRGDRLVVTRKTIKGSSVDSAALAAELSALMARPGGTAGPPSGDDPIRFVVTSDRQMRLNIAADRLTFPPFAASLRLADGRWATVQPPHGLIDPWQMRMLIALAITALLLAPLVWLMARRLTRPIRVFATAAERLGADPDAAPLVPSGPTEVRTAITAFNDMQAALRDHMRQRTQTIAAIAHDLRTPLTRLRFRAEQVPAGLRDRMAADVEEMDALIGQAMAFVRGEAQVERRESLDLAALAAACADGFAETGATVTFAGGKPLPVLGDPAALRRAIGNLIDNAVKFAGSARVETIRQGDMAVITIVDSGPGLPEAELEAVFEPFHRGERSRNRQTGGAGLGLAVARQAARAADGEVTLSNRTGGGLMACLTVPLAS